VTAASKGSLRETSSRLDADPFALAMSGIVGRRLMYKDRIGEGSVPTGNQ